MSLAHMPQLSIADIEDYHTKVNESLLKNSSTISKPCVRGKKLLQENFIDSGSTYTKGNNKHFFSKVCGACLKKSQQVDFFGLIEKHQKC